MIKFKIVGEKGDTALAYDLESAEEKFDELKERNLVPFAKSKGVAGLKKINDLKGNPAEVIWFPRVAGG